jgi:DNA-binding CsgD family transcriptional regulator
MSPLRRADLQAILDFLVDANELDFRSPYTGTTLARLNDLVPAPILLYEEANVAARKTVALSHESGRVDTDNDALYWRLGPCPITGYRAVTGDLAAIRVSDVVGRRAFLDSPIYQDWMAPERCDYHLEIGLEPAGGNQRQILFIRHPEDGDFSTRDLAMLQTLRPHLDRLEADAARRRQLEDLLAARQALDGLDVGPRLTTREREIVELVGAGLTNGEIAARLWVAPSTVKKHLENVYSKLGVGRRAAAATYLRAAN